MLENIVPPPVQTTACPSCGRALKGDAVLCTTCGYNVQLGFRAAPPSRMNAAIEASAPWFMAPVYLYFRPARFFQNFVNSPPLLTALFAWMFGMAGVIDRLDTRMMLTSAPLAVDSWSARWGIILLGGVLTAALYYSIGGWWYRVRVGWSGGRTDDSKLVRRVYLLASMVVVLPVLLAEAAKTMTYARPSELALSNFSLWDGILLVALFWSLWASHTGVRTILRTRTIPGLIWFLILPGLIYLVVGVGAMIALFALAAQPPDLSRTTTFGNSSVLFHYPANWVMDTQDPDFEAETYVTVEPVWQDAIWELMLFDSEEDMGEELQASMDGLGASMQSVRETGRFSTWGSHTGRGVEFSARVAGQQFLGRIFIMQHPQGHYMEIHEITAASARDVVEPGFELIRSRFALR